MTDIPDKAVEALRAELAIVPDEFDGVWHIGLPAADWRALSAASPFMGAVAREAMSQMMLRQSLATGHGDDFDALLRELEWQIAERAKQYDGMLTTWAESRERHLTAEAKVARLRGTLEYIAAQAKQGWPDGFFAIGGDNRLRECATEGCGQHVSIRVERDGTGSDHCEPCAREIAALATRPVPAAEPAPARVAEPVASEAIAKLIEHHRLDCSRMVHGQCSTRRCLVRGGWEAGDGSGYSKATCEALETCRALEALERATPPARQDALREARAEYDAAVKGWINGGVNSDTRLSRAGDALHAALAAVPATEAREGE